MAPPTGPAASAPHHGWTVVAGAPGTTPLVLVRALPGWKANVGLVVGTEKALLVDSGAGPRQAAEILQAVRAVTELPLAAVNTHSHFDHVNGNAYLLAHGVEPLYGHPATASALAQAAQEPEAHRSAVTGFEPDFAAGDGEYARILPPTEEVGEEPVELDLGGVLARLVHLGRGHTDGDLVVGVGDVLFCGDVVEEGADPAFEDSYPRDWIAVLDRIAGHADRYGTFVPGHGLVVGIEHVLGMRDRMRQAVRVAVAAVRQSPEDATKAVPILPYGPEQSRVVVKRLRALEAAGA